MGYRAGFYALILAVALLGGRGLGLWDSLSHRSGQRHLAASASPLQGENIDNSGGDNSGGDNRADGDNRRDNEGDNQQRERVVIVEPPKERRPAPAERQQQVSGAPQQCGFQLGFAFLRAQILAAEGYDAVGPCLEDEHGNVNPDGSLINLDTLQRTANGLMVWRAPSSTTGPANTTAFTDGVRTWVWWIFGLQVRFNWESFCWEVGGQEPCVGPIGLGGPGAL